MTEVEQMLEESRRDPEFRRAEAVVVQGEELQALCAAQKVTVEHLANHLKMPTHKVKLLLDDPESVKPEILDEVRRYLTRPTADDYDPTLFSWAFY